MAKPARVKRKHLAAEPAKKGQKRTVEKAPVKGKTKARKPEAKGFKARVTRAQPARAARPAKGAAAPKERRSPTRFLREVRLELSKVTWPSREELIQSTIVVIIAVVIAGVYIFAFDAVFSRLISLLNSLF